jgi:hypothetical protein
MFPNSFEPERGVTSITPLPVNPYSAEKLLVKTVKSFTNPDGIIFCPQENVHYCPYRQLNRSK